MKRFRIPIFLIGLLLLALIFWHCVIPGIFLALLFRGRWERMVTIVAAALISIVLKLTTGGWNPVIYIYFDFGLVFEIIQFLIGWIMSGILFYAGYTVPKRFREGWEAAQTKTE